MNDANLAMDYDPQPPLPGASSPSSSLSMPGSTSTSSSSQSSISFSHGAIAGTAVGVAVAVCLAVGVTLFCTRRNRQSKGNYQQPPEMDANNNPNQPLDVIHYDERRGQFLALPCHPVRPSRAMLILFYKVTQSDISLVSMKQTRRQLTRVPRAKSPRLPIIAPVTALSRQRPHPLVRRVRLPSLPQARQVSRICAVLVTYRSHLVRSM